MKSHLLAAAAATAALAGGLTAAPALAQETDPALSAAVSADYDYLFDLYTHFHANPELSFQESESAARIAAELTELGFAVTEGVGQTGLVAVMENGGGPTLMIRADMDALPVKEQTGLPYASTVMATDTAGETVPVMHACGHDVHMTVLVGTARRLAAMTDSWSGTLMLIAQPAEEIGSGARAMLEDGLFDRFPTPDFNIALHDDPALEAGMVGYVPGFAMANVDSVDIEVKGVGGHGAYPHLTKDPIVLASEIVVALQTLVSRETPPQEPAVVTVGSFHGGTKHNIIGDSAHLQLTVRSYSDERRRALLDGIERISVNMGRVAGLPDDMLPEVTFSETEYTPATYNDPELTMRVAGVIGEQIGADNVVELTPMMGGEDFGRYGRTDEDIPSLLFRLGGLDPAKKAAAEESGESLPGLHSPLWAPLPEPTLTTGVEAMTAAALDLLGS